MERASGISAGPMLSYQEAFEKIIENSLPLKPRRTPLRESIGLAVARDIVSPEPFPRFDNSAVDGYAVSQIESPEKTLKIQGEIPAGEVLKGRLRVGHAVQIFTGAALPRGTWAVVMQEHTERANGTLRLLKTPKLGENIRFRGEDFQKARVLVRKGTLLQATHLALLAAVGYTRVLVQPSPRIAILATGSELSGAEGRPPHGKIRDSNTIFLEMLVWQAGGTPFPLPNVGDIPRNIRAAVRKGLQSDLFIISGGVSVGKYDFVKEALKKEKVREIFWKVNIKPGKPLFFGEKKHTLVFGLPGNSVSAFVTFEEFVKPAILRMLKRPLAHERWVQGNLTKGFQNGSRLHFARVRCLSRKSSYKILPLKGQGSHQIGELAAANALLRVEPNAVLKRGQRVSVKMISKEPLS